MIASSFFQINRSLLVYFKRPTPFSFKKHEEKSRVKIDVIDIILYHEWLILYTELAIIQQSHFFQ